jgi:hypothetical protein
MNRNRTEDRDAHPPHRFLALISIFNVIAENKEGLMPIPREQFLKGSDTTQNNILNFLKEHPEEAYNAKEIAEAFGIIDAKSEPIRIAFAVYSYSALLDTLVKKNVVRRKIIDGVPHYIFLETK